MENENNYEKIDLALFEHVVTDPLVSEEIAGQSIGFFKDSMKRLFKNKVATICFIFLVVLISMAILVPILSPFDMDKQYYAIMNADFMIENPETGNIHIWGTDRLGRDVFVRAWEGARTSLFIAFVAVTINVIVGVIYGGISGYYGGMLDSIMMRIVEVVSGLPYLMVVILLMQILPKGLWSIVVAYSLVGWTGTARLVRGQVMALKEQEFVIAAQTMGASSMRIILLYLIPNTFSVVVINMTLAIPSAIFTEAFLSYLGLGVAPPACSWGTLANDGITSFQQYPQYLIVPAILISCTMLAFNLFGDALRDALDPKLRR